MAPDSVSQGGRSAVLSSTPRILSRSGDDPEPMSLRNHLNRELHRGKVRGAEGWVRVLPFGRVVSAIQNKG